MANRCATIREHDDLEADEEPASTASLFVRQRAHAAHLGRPGAPTIRAPGSGYGLESPTAARMMAPCSARSQYALDAEERERRTDHAEQHDAEHRAGNRAATAVIAVPPTTTAAMTFISRPRPVLRRYLIESHRVERSRRSR